MAGDMLVRRCQATTAPMIKHPRFPGFDGIWENGCTTTVIWIRSSPLRPGQRIAIKSTYPKSTTCL